MTIYIIKGIQEDINKEEPNTVNSLNIKTANKRRYFICVFLKHDIRNVI